MTEIRPTKNVLVFLKSKNIWPINIQNLSLFFSPENEDRPSEFVRHSPLFHPVDLVTIHHLHIWRLSALALSNPFCSPKIYITTISWMGAKSGTYLMVICFFFPPFNNPYWSNVFHHIFWLFTSTFSCVSPRLMQSCLEPCTEAKHMHILIPT